MIDISITGLGSISALGYNWQQVSAAYNNPKTNISLIPFEEKTAPFGALSDSSLKILEDLKQSNKLYKDLDKSVLMAIHASRDAVKQANWEDVSDVGVNIGSSRGTTEKFEQHFSQYQQKKYCDILSSPTTTLGNISSWVAQDLGSKGFSFSHSITCSTALHALVNGIAWLKSGMADRFLVGGSEAPLTDFTIAQFKALKICSEAIWEEYPCRSLDLSKRLNTMVLGEGAAVIALEKGRKSNRLALVKAIGFSVEKITHHISISADAQCLQRSMQMALSGVDKSSIDAVILHAPGTIKGDISEVNAIKAVFGSDIPALVSNKWKIGHTFGASGMLSVEMALQMMANNALIPIPYLTEKKVKDVRRVLVNAVGFGGNAVSVLLEK